jgi:hypothetical protein
LNTVLNVLLLGLLITSFVTGWLTSLLGLSDFAPHRFSSFALLIVAGGHLGVHWRSLAGQLRRWRVEQAAELGNADRRGPAGIVEVAPLARG